MKSRLFSLLVSVFGFVVLMIMAVFVALYVTRLPLGYQSMEWNVTNLKDPSQVRLLMIGDAGMGDENQKMVSRAMEQACLEAPTDGVIMLGDNFYMDGVADAFDPQWKMKFEEMYDSSCLSKIPFYAVLGNHDYKGNPSAQIEYSRMHPERWVMPARAYALNFSDLVNFAMVDTNFPDSCGFGFCSLDRVKQVFRDKPARWTLVAGHHPVISSGKYPRMKWLKSFFFKPFLCEIGTTVYFSGHDHDLQHLYLEPPQTEFEGCSYDQVIAGGGGGPLNELNQAQNSTRFQKSVFGFAVGVFDKNQMTVEFRSGENNETLYSFKK